MMKKFSHIQFLVIIYFGFNSNLNQINGHTQPTIVDNMVLRSIFHTFRNYIFHSVGRTSEKIPHGSFYLQKSFPFNQPFPCRLNNTRSYEIPSSVHKLRPGMMQIFKNIYVHMYV